MKLMKNKTVFNTLSVYVLYALVFTLPFERIPSLDLTLAGSSLTVRANSVLALILCLVSLPLLWQNRRELLTMPYVGLIVFLFVYLFSVALSSELSRAVMVYGFTFLTIATAVSIANQLTSARLETLKKVLYWSTWVVLAFGFYQYLGDIFGLSTSLTGLRTDYTKVVFGFPRIQSVGLEPLYYANFLMIPFFVFAADFLKKTKERPILLIAIIMQISLTVSRGAFAGMLIGLAVLVIFASRNKTKFFQIFSLGSFVVLGVLLALLMTNIEIKSVGTTGKESGEKKTEAIVSQATNFDTQDDRDRNRDLAWSAFTQRPVFGLGPGGFDNYARANAPVYEGAPGRLIVNNEPLELLAEGGIVAFVTLLITLLWIVWKVATLVWQGKLSDKQYAWGLGLLAYLCALAVQYQTFSTLYIMHVWVAIGLLMGILINAGKVHKKATSATQKNTS
ncbi:MAG: hypothetical protein QG632_555 [Candidatus Dependentiae bacterium]|nr:hypothetical protein [Candidatus Dependentiae bacterium]